MNHNDSDFRSLLKTVVNFLDKKFYFTAPPLSSIKIPLSGTKNVRPGGAVQLTVTFTATTSEDYFLEVYKITGTVSTFVQRFGAFAIAEGVDRTETITVPLDANSKYSIIAVPTSGPCTTNGATIFTGP